MTTLARENRALPEELVIDFLRDAAPSAIPHTKRVGRWLWIMFPERPDTETLATVKDLGFRFSRRRSAWLHPCGHPCRRRARGYDPRDKYGVRDVDDDE
jgi:hypothetical protein